ncbi:hypothetical protein OsJ_34899 [Oryza sativa Japonica Group]|uniref:Uncharacterized protein n=2 Tax=Oryza sativa subsp. japonica TaxID=39947 RepID=B9GBD6_ORYSJ|nr:hypothetical protein OsJ_34899 [Oryza sativa Japonica Group]
MASPCRIPAATGSGNKENNISQNRRHVLDCQTPCEGKGVATSKKRKNKPAGGFNLRKSIAWNPAFFTEQGVLDNTELSMLTGSQVKATRSPASGFSSTFSPLSRFGKSSNTSVLKEIGENSRGKFPSKCLSAENKGRKLFASSKASEQDERKALAVSSSHSILLTYGNAIIKAHAISRFLLDNCRAHRIKVPNSSGIAQIQRIPKKSEPSPSVVSRSRSTSSVTNVPKPTTRPATVTSECTHKVEGLPLKSKTERSSVTKSSGPTIGKDMVPPTVTTICQETNGSGKCETFSPYSQDNPSSSVVAPARISAKPSALRMPSPSVGFFTQGKASVSHSGTAQRNPERCFSGNISSVKPPRYKQPVDPKSRFHLTKQLPTNFSAASSLPVQPATSDSTPNVLASSLPGVEDATVCSLKQSLSESTVPYSEKSGNISYQEMPDDDFSLAGNGATTELSFRDNDDGRNSMPNECSVALSVGQDLNAICCSSTEPAEDSCFLKVICSSSEPSVGSNLTTSCISSPGCTPNDLNSQSKSDNGETAVDIENSLSGETSGTVCSSEGNNCTSATDSLQKSDSCHQQNMLVQSIHCTDQIPQFDSSTGIKPSLAYSQLDSNNSLCSEVQLTSSEGPDIDSEMELDTDDSFTVEEPPLLHVGDECDHDYRSAECSHMNLAAPSPCVDQEALAGNLTEKVDTADGRTESHHCSTQERRPILSEEQDTEDKIGFDTKLSSSEGASSIERIKSVGKSRTNTISKDHLKNLVPFTEEWLAVMEAFGEEVLEQKTGAVQNSPTDKAAPEPSPWSPVKRKAQDVGPFDCTKYSKNVRTSD